MPEELTPEERIARHRARRLLKEAAKAKEKAREEQQKIRRQEEKARQEDKAKALFEASQENALKSAGAMALSLRLPENKRSTFLLLYQNDKKSETTLLLVSLFLGFLGVDRFLLGQSLFGILKLVTLGGCGVWALLDWFCIMGDTRIYNNRLAYKIFCQFRL
jgi:TM2 domain-containing membrane protein YozV